jgi:hypothetical protein
VDGDFSVDGGKCITTETAAGLLKIIDLCSSSCCGCDELQALMAAIKQVEAQKDQLKGLINTVVAQQSAMIANLAAQQQ